MEPAQRWQLLATVTRLADYSPVWMNVLNTQPEAGADTQAYLDWIDQTLPLLETEAETMHQRIVFLNQQQIELATQYSQTSQKSLSFSPNIEIQRKEDLAPVKMRPSSTLILVGGVTGLLMGLLSQLVIITSWQEPPVIQVNWRNIVAKVARIAWVLFFISLPVTSFPLFPADFGGRTLVRPLAIYPLVILLVLLIIPRMIKRPMPSTYLPLLAFTLVALVSTIFAFTSDLEAFRGITPISRLVAQPDHPGSGIVVLFHDHHVA